MHQLATVTAGQGAPQNEDDFDEVGEPFIRAGSLDALLSGAEEDSCERVPAQTAKKYGLKLFPPDTVLFAKSGMSAKKGRVYKLKRSAYVTNHLAALVPDGRANPDYLYRWLSFCPPTHLIPNESYPSIRLSDVEELLVPIPLADAEQQRVVAILGQADAIRTSRRAALGDADSIIAATFVDMFGDARTIFDRWPVRALGELLKFLTSGSRGWAQYYSPSGAKFIRIENVRRGWLDLGDCTYVDAPQTAEARRTRVAPGDVLLSITADLGRCAVVPEDIGEAYINQHLALMRPEGVNPVYLSAFLTTAAGQAQFTRLNRSGVKAGLNFDDIRSVRVPLPPLEIQHRFAVLETGLRRLRERANAALTEADDLYSSLAAQAFRGKL